MTLHAVDHWSQRPSRDIGEALPQRRRLEAGWGDLIEERREEALADRTLLRCEDLRRALAGAELTPTRLPE